MISISKISCWVHFTSTDIDNFNNMMKIRDKTKTKKRIKLKIQEFLVSTATYTSKQRVEIALLSFCKTESACSLHLNF